MTTPFRMLTPTHLRHLNTLTTQAGATLIPLAHDGEGRDSHGGRIMDPDATLDRALGVTWSRPARWLAESVRMKGILTFGRPSPTSTTQRQHRHREVHFPNFRCAIVAVWNGTWLLISRLRIFPDFCVHLRHGRNTVRLPTLVSNTTPKHALRVTEPLSICRLSLPGDSASFVHSLVAGG